MNWSIEFLPEANDDLGRLDGSVRPQILKGIRKVSQDPLSDGYGKPLGNLSGSDLSGLMKIKFKKIGIRVVYKVEITDNVMKITKSMKKRKKGGKNISSDTVCAVQSFFYTVCFIRQMRNCR